MDRQAWIALTLCVLGLIGWYAYMAKTVPPVPAPVPALAGASPAPEARVAIPTASPAPAANAAAPAPTPEPVVAFAEKTQVLRNADVELVLTNRGGGISEARLLNHAGPKEKGKVVLNAPDRLPIGALLAQPSTDALAEFTVTKAADGSVQFERTTADGLSIRKRFSFLPPTAPKDNYLIEMTVDFRNNGAQAHTNPGYFVTLGSTVPLHPSDMTVYTRLVWFVGGKAKETDVNWFASQKYPILGIERRAEQKVFQEKVNGAEWGAVSGQFFTSLITPLDGKVSEVWARPFEFPWPDGKPLLGMEGAMGMPGFVLEPGQAIRSAFKFTPGRNSTRVSRSSSTERPRS